MKLNSAFKTLALVLPMLAIVGCTTVVRENIISSVETGIGATIAENPKTELYEAKVGYIRSQFYSIPTGKMLVKGRKKGDTNEDSYLFYTNSADITPEVVSGIKMNSDARHLFLGMSVSENFAVGKTAVNSRAAVAMYLADAAGTNAAASASQAVQSFAAPVTTP
jgi:hypothetical protein